MTSIGGASDKIDIIQDAYSQMRINGLTVSPSNEDLELALSRLERMAAEWQETRGIDSNYFFEDAPDPNSDSGISNGIFQCFSTNLAIRLIPDFNKVVPSILMALAASSLSGLSTVSAVNKLRQVQYPVRQPRGSGNTQRYYRWSRFYRAATTQPADYQMSFGDIDDFIEHFDSYLMDTEVISSFTITLDASLTLISSSLVTPDVNYRIEAKNSSDATSNQLQQATIVATTDTGRVETRIRYFELSTP